MTDDEIIAALKGNNEKERTKALKELYGVEYRNMVRSFLFKNSGSESDIAEMHQHIIIKFFEKVQRNQFERRKDVRLKTYLYVILRNSWLKEIRQKNRFVDIQDTEEYLEATHQDDILSAGWLQAQGMLHEFMKEFAGVHLDCIKLLKGYFYSKIGDGEMAAHLNIDVVTVRTRRFRCLKKARNLLQSKGLTFESFTTTTYEA